MENQLDCPACGAPLNIAPQAQPTAICPYCKTRVVLPPELRSAAEPAQGDGLPGVSAEVPQVEEVTPVDTLSPTQGKILLWVVILVVVVPVCTGLATSLCGTVVAVLAPFLGMLKH